MTDPLAVQEVYLDMALREYLAMREEYRQTVRQNMTNVMSTLAGAGAVVVLVVPNLAGLANELRSLLLLGTVVVVNGIFLGSLGLLNTGKILLDYLDRSADDIRSRIMKLSGEDELELLKYQTIMSDFSQGPITSKITSLAWLASYGTAPVLIGIGFMIVLTMIISGGWLALSADPPFGGGFALLVFDVLLTVLLLIAAVASVTSLDRWRSVFGRGSLSGRHHRPR